MKCMAALASVDETPRCSSFIPSQHDPSSGIMSNNIAGMNGMGPIDETPRCSSFMPSSHDLSPSFMANGTGMNTMVPIDETEHLSGFMPVMGSRDLGPGIVSNG